MKTATPARVNYFENQFLRRQEFADEQGYQIALRRRHNVGHHSWGIVSGLELALEGGALVVHPGTAIDGYGRELLLPATKEITSEFQRLGSNRLDVWLFYENMNSADAPKGFVPCRSDDSQTYYRTRETPRLFLERAGVSRINARRPKLVPAAILDAAAQLQTPDDPLVVWPVYLGRVVNVPEESDPEKQFLIDGTDRPYIGAVAEVIDHPASAARVEIGRVAKDPDKRVVAGKEIFYADNPARAFAVFVPLPQQTPLEPRFEIDLGSNNYLRGATKLNGSLIMADGAVKFIEATPNQPDAPRDHPSIYRAVRQKTASESGADELRIDLGKSDGPPPSFIVGFTTDDGTFRPSLKLEYTAPEPGIEPQPTLTIYGDLKLAGQLRGSAQIDRVLTEETLNALLASFQSGIAAGGGK